MDVFNVRTLAHVDLSDSRDAVCRTCTPAPREWLSPARGDSSLPWLQADGIEVELLDLSWLASDYDRGPSSEPAGPAQNITA